MKQEGARFPAVFPCNSSRVILVSANMPCDCKTHYGWSLDYTLGYPGNILSAQRKLLEREDRSHGLSDVSAAQSSGEMVGPRCVTKNPGIVFSHLRVIP